MTGKDTEKHGTSCDNYYFIIFAGKNKTIINV